MTVLRTLGWLIGIVYSTIPSFWLVVHPRARRFGNMARAPLFIVGPIWFGMWVLVGALTWPWHSITLYSSLWPWIPAAILFLLGFTIYAGAGRNFSTDQFLGRSELQPELHIQKLRTGGIRSRVRHPVYLGHLCELLAWAIGTGLIVLYALSALAIVTGYYMIRAEDMELEERFGDEFRSYTQNVPAIIPRFW